MARPANSYTYNIRQHVTQWLTRTKAPSFTVPMLIHELASVLDIYKGIDLSKCLGNELIRRQKAGMLKSEVGEPCGVGRPPRVYKQLWKV